MILVYDTETTGLPRTDLPAEAHDFQPHLVQLGVSFLTDTGKEVCSADLIVKPDGWSIPDGAAKVHGITTGIAKEVGIPLATVLSVFTQLRANASETVAYNLEFDDLILRAAISRIGRKPAHPGPEKNSCCKIMATPVLNLPPTAKMKAAGFTKPKPPTLMETYKFLFNEEFEGAHSALVDARACARCFFELKRREAEAAT